MSPKRSRVYQEDEGTNSPENRQPVKPLNPKSSSNKISIERSKIKFSSLPSLASGRSRARQMTRMWAKRPSPSTSNEHEQEHPSPPEKRPAPRKSSIDARIKILEEYQSKRIERGEHDKNDKEDENEVSSGIGMEHKVYILMRADGGPSEKERNEILGVYSNLKSASRRARLIVSQEGLSEPNNHEEYNLMDNSEGYKLEVTEGEGRWHRIWVEAHKVLGG